MSLTSFLQDKDVRKEFSQEFIKPRFSLRKAILSPPITKNYGLVGTAFDYLMRFYIERLNPRAITSTWVAEQAVEKMGEVGSGLYGSARFPVKIPKGMLRRASAVISEAKRLHSSYIISEEMNNELIKYAVLLAQFDTYFRTGIIWERLEFVEEGDVADLKNLISIVNPEIWKAKEMCILNPTFGEASELVGGADADLVIDNMLIDIKTTSRLELKRDDFNQLVGYYILFRIGGIDNAPFVPKIERLGIYWSRYAELQVFPVREVIDERKITSFMEWFKSKASGLFSSRKSTMNQTLN